MSGSSAARAAKPASDTSLEDKLLQRLSEAGRPLRPAELLKLDVAQGIPEETVRLAVLTLIQEGRVEFTPDWRVSVKAVE